MTLLNPMRFVVGLFSLCVACAAVSCAQADDFETVTFDAADGLTITADVYIAHDQAQAPMLLLFHQAGWSRGEYRETAPKFNAMGFNCIAIDQRSGGGANDVENQTVLAAQAAGKDTGFVDAYADMEAALAYVRENYPDAPVLIVGSSYSAALVFHLAADHPDDVAAVLSFSPGEYFERFGKPGDWIESAAANVQCPVFVTSARGEATRWATIFAAVESDAKQSYTPNTGGQHGSRALWEQFDDHAGYWAAVEAFLGGFVGGE